MRWVAPAFAQYDLGERYTGWLYGDEQSNPMSWDKPDLWPHAGVVQVQDRTLSVVVPSGGATPFESTNTKVTEFNLTGGKNAVVFSRYAFVEPGLAVGGGISQQVPTQSMAYAIVRQNLVEGYQEIQDTAVCNVFGTGWSPQIFPAPMTWNDKLRRVITLSNVTSAGDLYVTLVWKVAYLNTGA
jgi:hypothetical protein